MLRLQLRSPLLACTALLALAGMAIAQSEEAAIRGEPNFLTGHPAQNADGSINVVIEIPAGTSQKWEVSHSGETLEWEMVDGRRRVVAYLPYPANYGMLPRTLQANRDGGDGDPLDALVLGPALPRGSVVPARLVAMLVLRDDGEIDDKLVAVPLEMSASPLAGVRQLDELKQQYPGVLEILRTWFENYKGPGRIHFGGFRDRVAAHAAVDRAAAAFEAAAE